MRLSLAVVALVFFVSSVFAQANDTTEGGNITAGDLNLTAPTSLWAGIVGWLNGSTADTLSHISFQAVNQSDIYTNEPNGSYIDFYNFSMIVTRLPFMPNVTDFTTPTQADFEDGGIFENFTVFAPVNSSMLIDGPDRTFCDPACSYRDYNFYMVPYSAAYIFLQANTDMGVLKFDNGTHTEPIFVGSVENLLGFNGTFFDFEYMVPTHEDYYFYIYAMQECNITVWIDDVQTTVFPNTGVPYKVEFMVLDNSSSPLSNAVVRVVEDNGRNFIFPNLEPDDRFFHGTAEMYSNSTGRAIYALSPTRYNIPDSYGYEVYVEALKAPYYCRRDMSIGNYGALVPTYRTSLVNDLYGSQVKSSVQNMNSLSSTASLWVNAQKIRVITMDVYTNGSYTAPPTIKVGAPNLLNITAYHGTTEINATMRAREDNGLIIYAPLQPDKELYNNTAEYYTNETPVIIPTRYNNDANFTIIFVVNNTEFATVSFPVDSVLGPPGAGEGTMDSATYSLIASALQNINSVLVNIGKSISTV